MAEALSGMDISKIMAEEGTLVQCVLLRCHPRESNNDHDTKPASNDARGSNEGATKPLSEMSIKEMKKELLHSYGVTEQFVEKAELVKALQQERDKRQDAKSCHSIETSSETPSQESSTTTTQLESTVPLSHLIEQITVDTTPRKSQVSKLLGGDFTFLGQYESEGVMVMIRRPDWENKNNQKHSSGKDEDDDTIPDINPHVLQPPLNDVKVRGDILLMRVAETEEELDTIDDTTADDKDGDVDNNNATNTVKKLHVPSNDEFFLDYTRDEYLKFAARTDVVWEGPEEVESEEECDSQDDDDEEEEDDDENDETYDPQQEAADHHPSDDEEEEDAEEYQIGMMNMILGQILRKFHEENGRGPNTLELLDMRKAVADRLGVDVPEVDVEACDWDKKVETPKKHDRRVVVDELKNECETIECGEVGEHRVDDDNVDDDDHGTMENGDLEQFTDVTENGGNVQKEQEIVGESVGRKRVPQAVVENGSSPNDDEEPMTKKQKLDQDGGGDS